MRAKPKPMAQIPKNRLPFLEGIRGLAALYVVFGHISTLSDPSASAGRHSHAPEWLQRVTGWFSYGHLAVAAFIVISGFCLELALFSRENGALGSLKRFYKRRAQRILPPYYACLAISIYVALRVTIYQVGAPFNQYLPVDQTTVLTHVFLIHNFSPEWMYKINGVLWSIAIEAQLYIVFPLFVLGINKLGRLITLAAAGLVAYAVIAQIPQAPKMYVWYLPLFVGGMVAAHLAFKPNRIGRLPVVASLLAVGCLYGCIRTAAPDKPLYSSDLFMGFAIAGVCYAMSCAARGPLYRFLILRPIVFLGTFSYSLYLMHHPIAQLLYANRPAWVGGETSLFMYFVACLPIILFWCWAFHLVFERPFMPRGSAKPAPEKKRGTPVALPLRVYSPSGADATPNGIQNATAQVSVIEP